MLYTIDYSAQVEVTWGWNMLTTDAPVGIAIVTPITSTLSWHDYYFPIEKCSENVTVLYVYNACAP